MDSNAIEIVQESYQDSRSKRGQTGFYTGTSRRFLLLSFRHKHIELSVSNIEIFFCFLKLKWLALLDSLTCLTGKFSEVFFYYYLLMGVHILYISLTLYLNKFPPYSGQCSTQERFLKRSGDCSLTLPEETKPILLFITQQWFCVHFILLEFWEHC